MKERKQTIGLTKGIIPRSEYPLAVLKTLNLPPSLPCPTPQTPISQLASENGGKKVEPSGGSNKEEARAHGSSPFTLATTPPTCNIDSGIDNHSSTISEAKNVSKTVPERNMATRSGETMVERKVQACSPELNQPSINTVVYHKDCKDLRRVTPFNIRTVQTENISFQYVRQDTCMLYVFGHEMNEWYFKTRTNIYFYSFIWGVFLVTKWMNLCVLLDWVDPRYSLLTLIDLVLISFDWLRMNVTVVKLLLRKFYIWYLILNMVVMSVSQALCLNDIRAVIPVTAFFSLITYDLQDAYLIRNPSLIWITGISVHTLYFVVTQALISFEVTSITEHEFSIGGRVIARAPTIALSSSITVVLFILRCNYAQYVRPREFIHLHAPIHFFPKKQNREPGTGNDDHDGKAKVCEDCCCGPSLCRDTRTDDLNGALRRLHPDDTTSAVPLNQAVNDNTARYNTGTERLILSENNVMDKNRENSLNHDESCNIWGDVYVNSNRQSFLPQRLQRFSQNRQIKIQIDKFL